MSERASIFESATDFDVGGFAPKTAQSAGATLPPDVVRTVSEGSSFRSREPLPASVPTARREPRRHRTGRNVQLNVKVRAETLDTFHRIADTQGWILAETIEKALLALERELANTNTSLRTRE